MLLLGERFNPNYYLGNKMRVFLKTGGIFNVVVMDRVFNFINCIDDDGSELTIDLEDIDFIVDIGS